jgi:CBS domain-containing protein
MTIIMGIKKGSGFICINDKTITTMKQREPITHIMTKNVKTVNLSDNLFTVRDMMIDNHFRHVPVMNGSKLVGILSKTDIMRLSFGSVFANQESADEAVLEMLTIEQVMRSSIRTINADATIKEAAEIFASEEFHALPVIEGDKLVGIVTTTDIINYLLEQY